MTDEKKPESLFWVTGYCLEMAFLFISDQLAGHSWSPSFQTTTKNKTNKMRKEGKTGVRSQQKQIPYNYHKNREGSYDMVWLNGPLGMWFYCSQQHHCHFSYSLLLLNILSYLTTGNHSQQCKEPLFIFKRHWQKLDGAGYITHTFVQLHNADQTELDKR